MVYDPEKHNCRSTRLKGYDYALPGWYFVTICAQNRDCLFGEIRNGKMVLNKWGRIANDEWKNTEFVRDNVKLDAFIIMPNHMHGIVGIVDTPLRLNIDPEKQTEFKSPSKTLGAIVRGYKSAVTKQINQIRNSPGGKKYGNEINMIISSGMKNHWNVFGIISKTIPYNGIKTVTIHKTGKLELG